MIGIPCHPLPLGRRCRISGTLPRTRLWLALFCLTATFVAATGRASASSEWLCRDESSTCGKSDNDLGNLDDDAWGFTDDEYGYSGDGNEVGWTLIPWIAGTHLDGATTEGGFAYGLTGGYRLTDSVGVFGAFGLNHTDARTQFLGTVGLQKFGNPYGCTLQERATLWGFFDYFNDDEVDDEAYQLRFNTGYLFADYVEAGVTFSIDLGDGPVSLSPFGGATLMYPGGSFVGGYYNRTIRRFEFFGQLGYSDAVDNVAGSIGLKRPIGNRAKAFVGVAGAGDDSLSGALGMEFGLGRNDTWQY